MKRHFEHATGISHDSSIVGLLSQNRHHCHLVVVIAGLVIVGLIIVVISVCIKIGGDGRGGKGKAKGKGMEGAGSHIDYTWKSYRLHLEAI